VISSRPYLIRAIYDWISESGLTPYLLVNAEASDVTVPSQYIQDGKIILNISSNAVRSLELTNDWVMFSARFSGVSMEVSVPPSTVLAIYAKENGRGMVFSDDDEEGPNPPGPMPSDDVPHLQTKGRPNLKVVK
jgi:stringent starvation protein B